MRCGILEDEPRLVPDPRLLTVQLNLSRDGVVNGNDPNKDERTDR